jgi:hypothetical protein
VLDARIGREDARGATALMGVDVDRPIGRALEQVAVSVDRAGSFLRSRHQVRVADQQG